MNDKRIYLGLLLFIALFSSSVNAQEDFKATSPRSVDLCPCSSQAYTITVDNIGTTASSYRVLASGAAAEWVTFSPDKFVLNPRQRGAFSVIVNSVCNIKGDFDLDVFIATNNGLAKVIKQNLKFSECYDYSLEQGETIGDIEESLSFLPHDASYSLCKNEQKSIPILITNNENFGNSYILRLDAPEWSSLSLNEVQLDAKKSGIFLINFDTADVEGEFNFKLNAISELGKVQKKKNIGVDVSECYSLDIDLEKKNDVVCGGEDKNYDVVIKNSGTLQHVVELELDAPEWADLVGNISFFDLEPGEREIETLNVNPGDDVSGNFLVSVFAGVKDKGGLRFSDEIQLDITPKGACYKADISAKASVTNFYSQDLFFVEVKNAGIKKATYEVSLEGVSWVSISPDSLQLNPGQTGNLNLIFSPNDDIDPGTYGIKINLESKDVIYSKNIDIVLKKESEFVKGLKANVKLYRYYLYLFVIITVLIIIFRKSIIRFKTNTKKRYERYKVKRERLMALKLARKEREEERDKKKETEEKRKQSKKIKKKKKLKLSFNRIWIYGLLIIVALVFIGHQNRLFNAKYLHLYIRNFFYSYLYYILIGVGTVIALFLLILFYNYVNKQGKKKVKKAVKKTEKKIRFKKKWYKIPYHKILFIILFGILIYSVSFFAIFENIKDFFVLYQYYMVLGIIILIMIIFLIRFYKPLFKFLKE